MEGKRGCTSKRLDTKMTIMTNGRKKRLDIKTKEISRKFFEQKITKERDDTQKEKDNVIFISEQDEESK